MTAQHIVALLMTCLYVASALVGIAQIGKKREPMSAANAIGGVVVSTVLSIAVWWLAS